MPSLANRAAFFIKFMNPLLQTGEVGMAIQFSHITSSWEFTCIFGCYQYDFEGEHEAREAWLFHDCVCSHDEPHGGLAWTPDEEIEESQERLRESHPEVWDQWLEWCRTNETPC